MISTRQKKYNNHSGDWHGESDAKGLKCFGCQSISININKMTQEDLKQLADNITANMQICIKKVLTAELAEIKRYTLLQAKSVLTLDDVALLTGLSKSHLYRFTHTHQIPFYKPNGKTVFFDRNEIEAWMRQNRVGTQQEAESGAIRYILDKEAGL